MRFTIRDVLWLTAVAALVAAWWVDHNAQRLRISALERSNADQSDEARKQADLAEEAWRILTETGNARRSKNR
jgi:hypothetical protein